jgi:hypothetical protein
MHLLNPVVEGIAVYASSVGPEEGHAKNIVDGSSTVRHNVHHELVGSERIVTDWPHVSRGAIYPRDTNPTRSEDSGGLCL